jgi:hypothetical protein
MRHWAAALAYHPDVHGEEDMLTIQLRASAAETEISYEDEDARAYLRWLHEHTPGFRAANEMHSFPERQSSRQAHHSQSSLAQSLATGSERSYAIRASSAHSRQLLVDSQAQQRVRTMGIYELDQLHRSMARAGWIG